MAQILAWGGSDPPVKNDFTANKGAYQLRYKINRLGVDYISEAKDKFRDPEAVDQWDDPGVDGGEGGQRGLQE